MPVRVKSTASDPIVGPPKDPREPFGDSTGSGGVGGGGRGFFTRRRLRVGFPECDREDFGVLGDFGDVVSSGGLGGSAGKRTDCRGTFVPLRRASPFGKCGMLTAAISGAVSTTASGL